MSRTTSLTTLFVAVCSAIACGQSSISVVGRVVKNSAPERGVEVVLAIAPIKDDAARIVKDSSDVNGIFQLAKSPIGDFSELYLWVEEPYSIEPKPFKAVKTD